MEIAEFKRLQAAERMPKGPVGICLSEGKSGIQKVVWKGSAVEELYAGTVRDTGQSNSAELWYSGGTGNK